MGRSWRGTSPVYMMWWPAFWLPWTPLVAAQEAMPSTGDTGETVQPGQPMCDHITQLCALSTFELELGTQSLCNFTGMSGKPVTKPAVVAGESLPHMPALMTRSET